ncbi:hypothetical protein CSW98_05385 [Vibrio sp. HA2012]|nr:hypothetical protein CSW98_05385 [Vibrio sp. HA2012]
MFAPRESRFGWRKKLIRGGWARVLPIRLRYIFLTGEEYLEITIKFHRKLKTINDFYDFYCQQK